MGNIISSIVGLGGSINSLIQHRKITTARKELEEKQEKSRALGSEQDPPFFYKTIQEREENVPHGPYSVDDIKDVLRTGGPIPSGYTLASLRQVGFGVLVDRYIENEEKEDKKIIDEMTGLLNSVREQIVSKKIDLTVTEQKALDLIQSATQTGGSIGELEVIINALPEINRAIQGRAELDKKEAAILEQIRVGQSGLEKRVRDVFRLATIQGKI